MMIEYVIGCSCWFDTASWNSRRRRLRRRSSPSCLWRRSPSSSCCWTSVAKATASTTSFWRCWSPASRLRSASASSSSTSAIYTTIRQLHAPYFTHFFALQMDDVRSAKVWVASRGSVVSRPHSPVQQSSSSLLIRIIGFIFSEFQRPYTLLGTVAVFRSACGSWMCGIWITRYY